MNLQETIEKMYALNSEEEFLAHISLMKRKAFKGLLEGITPSDIDRIANSVMNREDDPTLENTDTMEEKDPDSNVIFHQDEEVDVTPDGSFAYMINDLSNTIREFGDLAGLQESSENDDITPLSESEILESHKENKIDISETLESLLGGN